MHSSFFFRLFPPPKVMLMKCAGLHLTDDRIHMIEYDGAGRRTTIHKYASEEIPVGVIDDGDIKDEKKLIQILADFAKKNGIFYVKASIPEEKTYLFQTEVESKDKHAIAQGIEFKLEENVPLSAADAVYYFDLLPPVPGNQPQASVSVVPRSYIDNILRILRQAGMYPEAFEVLPKALARAVIVPDCSDTSMIVYIMKDKVGIYVVRGNIVRFTSTISWDRAGEGTADLNALVREISRVYMYWASHLSGDAPGCNVVLVGRNALKYEDSLRNLLNESGISVKMADVWSNFFDINHYIPPISREESLDFAAAAGLAID